MAGNDCDGECNKVAKEVVEKSFGGQWPGKRLPIATTISKAKIIGEQLTCPHGAQNGDQIRRANIHRICEEAEKMSGGICMRCVLTRADLDKKCTTRGHTCNDRAEEGAGSLKESAKS